MPGANFEYTRKMDEDCTIRVTVDAENPAKLAAWVGQIQLIFEQRKCQKCADEGRPADYGVILQKKIVDGMAFYELTCQNPDCGAAFGLGQRRDDLLFYPKRFASKKRGGGRLTNQGWVVYVPDGYQGEGGASAPVQQAPAPAPAAPPVEDDSIPF